MFFKQRHVFQTLCLLQEFKNHSWKVQSPLQTVLKSSSHCPRSWEDECGKGTRVGGWGSKRRKLGHCHLLEKESEIQEMVNALPRVTQEVDKKKLKPSMTSQGLIIHTGLCCMHKNYWVSQENDNKQCDLRTRTTTYFEVSNPRGIFYLFSSKTHMKNALICLHAFVIATLQNHHKCSGLKQYMFIILPFWRPEVQHGFTRLKTQVSAGQCFFLVAPGEILFPWLFHLLQTACIPWLTDPFLHVASHWPCFHCHIAFSHHSWKMASAFRDPCDYIGPNRITQDNLSISMSLL